MSHVRSIIGSSFLRQVLRDGAYGPRQEREQLIQMADTQGQLRAAVVHINQGAGGLLAPSRAAGDTLAWVDGVVWLDNDGADHGRLLPRWGTAGAGPPRRPRPRRTAR